ncbi:NlpC/P60 family protein [Thiomicrorhabdus arctica]|uniref:NlpC/P60 family protein n=1 Tax=Thiomicrorhabdus arctica TaxID=131540 RepID=UPI00037C50F6|nr:NlpC/P60 family protein [Thiomicrorhabdus arctica]
MNRSKLSVSKVLIFNAFYEPPLSHLKAAKILLKYMLALTLGTLVLTGCSNTPQYVNQPLQSVPLVSPVDLANSSKVKSRLLRQYQDWKGTPYHYGGTSRNGVDCSAFVQNTFYSQLGYKLPRTTRTQIKIGKKVTKSNLKVGDIVFFKTSSRSLHNGIYIGGSKFIHASSSQGVTISSLNNLYWRKIYLTSVRVR